MKLSLMENLNEETYHIVDENGEHYEWCDILVSMDDVVEVMNNAGSACCMDNADDHIRFLKGLIDKYNKACEEEDEMQEVPNDAIILTPDEARALLNASHDWVEYNEDDYDAAIKALDEQLEEDYTDED